MKAQGKKIVVTGGGNGVGRELVFQLIEKGATVFAADINAITGGRNRSRSLCL